MTDDERTCNTVENSSAKSKGVKMSKERSSKQFTRGGQIAFHDLRMFFQINKNRFFNKKSFKIKNKSQKSLLKP